MGSVVFIRRIIFVRSSQGKGYSVSKPVCAICRGDSGPTRCFNHLWSDRKWNYVSGPSIETDNECSGLVTNKKAGKIVAREVQQLCSECKKHSTPSTCVECKVPVCTSCKLKLNGRLGSYCCSVHVKKVEISVVVNRPLQLQPHIAGDPTDDHTGSIAEGLPEFDRMGTAAAVKKATSNNKSAGFLSPTAISKKRVRISQALKRNCCKRNGFPAS